MFTVALGETLDDYALPNQCGDTIRMSTFLGKWVVIYFYPKDDTPGCTKESIGFECLSAEFAALNTTIIGVSADSVASHRAFADKINVNFNLLSDENRELIEGVGVWGERKFMGKSSMGIRRSTIVLDSEGIVCKLYETVKAETHPQQVLEDIKALQA